MTADIPGAPPSSGLAAGPLAGAVTVFAGAIVLVTGLAFPQAQVATRLLGDSTVYPNSRATAFYIAVAGLATVFALVAVSQSRPLLTMLAGVPGLVGAGCLAWYISDLATGRRDQRLCDELQAFCGDTSRPGSGAVVMLIGTLLIVAGAAVAWSTAHRRRPVPGGEPPA